MPNTISVGGEKMSEKEKSDISFEAFKQVDKIIVLWLAEISILC